MLNLANRIKSVEQTIAAKTNAGDTESAGVKALRMIVNMNRSIHQNIDYSPAEKDKISMEEWKLYWQKDILFTKREGWDVKDTEERLQEWEETIEEIGGFK